MEYILQFCGKNIQLIITIATTIIGLISMILSNIIRVRVKKISITDREKTKLLSSKKMSDQIYEISCLLPSLIREAEAVFGSGKGHIKMDYVLKQIQTYINDNNFVGLSSERFVQNIESILSTPEKKGE